MSIKSYIKAIERIWYFSRYLLGVIIFLAIIHTFYLTIFIVDGISMAPTLIDKQVLFVNKISYLFNSPDKGDIVIMQFQGDPERRMFVKRVIALPGEILKAGQNDQYGVVTKKDLTLGSGQYYVLGDNRPNSGDSRIWGAVPRENIIGKVIF